MLLFARFTLINWQELIFVLPLANSKSRITVVGFGYLERHPLPQSYCQVQTCSCTHRSRLLINMEYNFSSCLLETKTIFSFWYWRRFIWRFRNIIVAIILAIQDNVGVTPPPQIMSPGDIIPFFAESRQGGDIIRGVKIFPPGPPFFWGGGG